MLAMAMASIDVMRKITPNRDTTKSWSILAFISAFFFFFGAGILSGLLEFWAVVNYLGPAVGNREAQLKRVNKMQHCRFASESHVVRALFLLWRYSLC